MVVGIFALIPVTVTEKIRPILALLQTENAIQGNSNLANIWS